MTKKNKTESESVLSGTGPARYIDPQTGFGFHKLFGTEANKFVLKGFLQDLLQDRGNIFSMKYLSTDDDTVYSIYCETMFGEKFIVEMQRAEHDYFNEKSVFYSSFPTLSQTKSDPTWDFKPDLVYAIGILGFVFEEDKNEDEYQYTHNVVNEALDNKMNIIYLALPKFTKRIDELKTLMDKWMYVLKNLSLLDKRPPELSEPIFERLFHVAEITRLTPGEESAYLESQKRRSDLNSRILDTTNRSDYEDGLKIAKWEKRLAKWEKKYADWKTESAEQEKKFTEKIAELKHLLNEKLS
jgi:predicted transposase/invertase (TIGR01784 family)